VSLGVSLWYANLVNSLLCQELDIGDLEVWREAQSVLPTDDEIAYPAQFSTCP